MIPKDQLFQMAHAPDADALAGTKTGDYLSLAGHAHMTLLVCIGVGATGTSTFTVLKATSNAGAGAVAIPFQMRLASGADTFAAAIDVAAAGYLSIAGSTKMIAIEVDADQLGDGFEWVAIKSVEGVDSPVDACIVAILSGARYGSESPASVQ